MADDKTTRLAYAAGLRALADVIEQDAQAGVLLEVPLTGVADHNAVDIIVSGRADAESWISRFDRIIEQGPSGSTCYAVTGEIGGLRVRVFGGATNMGGAKITKRVETFEVPPFEVAAVPA